MSRVKRGPSSTIVARFLHILLGGILLFLFVPALFAEVSVVTDAQGNYLRSVVLTRSYGLRTMIWSQVRRDVPPSQILNAEGDRMGDSRPVVLEQPGTRQPWVVWSASDGHDKEIAYATWSAGHWQGPQLVERVDNSFDDLNPRLAFDSAGNPVVVWWRREPVSRVYMSRFIAGEWTPATLVSDPAVPARLPSVRATGTDAIVSFYTPRGLTVLFVPLPSPVSVSPDGDGPLDGPVPPPDLIPHPSPGSGSNGGNSHGNGNPWNDPLQPKHQ
jgi:hypothetical protein